MTKHLLCVLLHQRKHEGTPQKRRMQKISDGMQEVCHLMKEEMQMILQKMVQKVKEELELRKPIHTRQKLGDRSKRLQMKLTR